MAGFNQQPGSFDELRSSLQVRAESLDDNSYQAAVGHNELVDRFLQVGSQFNDCQAGMEELLDNARNFCLLTSPYDNLKEAMHEPVALEVVLDAIDSSNFTVLRDSQAVAIVRAMGNQRDKVLTYKEMDLAPDLVFRIGYYLRSNNNGVLSYTRLPNEGRSARLSYGEVIAPESLALSSGKESGLHAEIVDRFYEATQLAIHRLGQARQTYQTHFGYLGDCLGKEDLNPGGKSRALTYQDLAQLPML